MAAAKKTNPLRDFNLNSILVIAAGALVTWLVTNGLSSIKDTKTAVTEIKVDVATIKPQIPYINQSVNNLQQDLNSKHAGLSQSISELKTGQTQTWSAIKDVRDEQLKVREELSQINK